MDPAIKSVSPPLPLEGCFSMRVGEEISGPVLYLSLCKVKDHPARKTKLWWLLLQGKWKQRKERFA